MPRPINDDTGPLPMSRNSAIRFVSFRFSLELCVLPGSERSRMKADIDPMTIDTNVNWESIGGMEHHVRALKEMVMFPLLYPEIFQVTDALDSGIC